MPFTFKQLTDAEKEEFLKNNFWGILSFAGDEPYALPIGYGYKKGAITMGFAISGRKGEYVKRSRNVCFTICTPAKVASDSNQGEAYPFTTVMIEGELRDMTDAERESFGYPPARGGGTFGLFILEPKRVGTQVMGFEGAVPKF